MSNEFAAKLYTQYANTREVNATERRIYSEITSPPAPQFIPVGTRVIVNLPDEGEFTGTVLSNGGVDSEFSFTYRVTLDNGMVVGANMGDVRPIPKVCRTKTPEPHLAGEFPMDCYACHCEELQEG